MVVSNNKKPTLIVDCDGVLINPIRGFVRWFLKSVPTLSLSEIAENQPLLKRFIITFLYSEEFSNIPPIHKSKEAISFLSRHFDIDVITSCGDSYTIRNSRLKNIDKFFGIKNFRNVYTLPYHSSKKEIFSKYDAGAIVIDDELINVVDATSCGHEAYWMRYHNKFLKNVFSKKVDIPYQDRKEHKAVNWNNIIKNISRDLNSK